MKIGVLSDTHDEVQRVARALEVLRGAGAMMLLHCGDITSPATVRAFAGWTTHFVLGNCDWDEAGLAAAMEAVGATNHGSWGHLEVERVSLAFLHGDDAAPLAFQPYFWTEQFGIHLKAVGPVPLHGDPEILEQDDDDAELLRWTHSDGTRTVVSVNWRIPFPKLRRLTAA